MYLHESLADPGTHRLSSSGWLVYRGTLCLQIHAGGLWEDCLSCLALSGFWKSEFSALMFVRQLLCPLGHLPSTWWYPDSSSAVTLALFPRNPRGWWSISKVPAPVYMASL